MKRVICACVFFHLFVTCGSWPRYGRPHPLYNRRQQTNEDLFFFALLLGLDFQEIYNIQAALGQGFDFGNFGIPNFGFPMNSYERNRARQDLNTLSAFGVIENPEELGPLGAPVNKGVPDLPDQPGGKDRGENGKRKSGAKGKGKSQRKVKTKYRQTDKRGKAARKRPLRGKGGRRVPRRNRYVDA